MNETLSVVVLGAGAMGLALARVLLKTGYHVTIWNRNPERCKALVEEGAALASSVPRAVESGDLIIICVSDYEASDAILSTIHDERPLLGKTIVQFSSMLPAQMDDQKNKVEKLAGRFVGGGILSAPSKIGSATAVIVYAGDRKVCLAYERVFKSLAGSSQYLGQDPTSAIAAYLTLGVYIIGVQSLFYETAVVANQLGLPLALYRQLEKLIADQAVTAISDGVRRVSAQRFGESEASISLIASFMRDARACFAKTGVPIPVTDGIVDQLESAIRSQAGDLDMAAIYDSPIAAHR